MVTWPVDADVVHGKGPTKLRADLPNGEPGDFQIRVPHTPSTSY